ncbi:MAG: putative capsular polysaccharide synthesis family protein [Candidatus Omnitrophica bacterium]|nr:putative capsular polysaccharide synthesis family protein [Candidatus Omnitrophota bacterium]
MKNDPQPFLEIVRKIKPLHAALMKVKAGTEARAAFRHPGQPPVLIYQMGKVGSSSVAHSLEQTGSRETAIHVHFLSGDIEKYGRTFEQAGRYPWPYHLYLGGALRKILRRQPETPVRIISLVRDPIAWAVSSVFQNPFLASESVQAADGSVDPQKAGDYLLRELDKPETFDYVNDWFDRELKTVFGIDVFAEPFPVETGFAVYRHQRAEALVIRMEDLSTKGPQAIAAFLGLPHPLEIQKANVREQTTAADKYKEVRARVRLSRELCERIYSGRLVRHFYNRNLIESFIRRWTGDQG